MLWKITIGFHIKACVEQREMNESWKRISPIVITQPAAKNGTFYENLINLTRYVVGK